MDHAAPRRLARWGARLWALRRVGLVAAVAVALPGLGVLGLFEPLSQWAEGVRGGEAVAAWWPAFVAVAAVLCGVAIMPTHGVSLAAGFVFGGAMGTLAAVASVVVGSLLGWRLAGWVAGRGLREAIEQAPAGRALSAAMIEARGGRAVLAVALARLPPQVPYALGNVVAASSGVRLGPLMLGTALGMLPRIAAVAWLGGELARVESAADVTTLVVGLAAAAVGLIGLGWWSWRVLRKMGRE